MTKHKVVHVERNQRLHIGLWATIWNTSTRRLRRGSWMSAFTNFPLAPMQAISLKQRNLRSQNPLSARSTTSSRRRSLLSCLVNLNNKMLRFLFISTFMLLLAGCSAIDFGYAVRRADSDTFIDECKFSKADSEHFVYKNTRPSIVFIYSDAVEHCRRQARVFSNVAMRYYDGIFFWAIEASMLLLVLEVTNIIQASQQAAQ